MLGPDQSEECIKLLFSQYLQVVDLLYGLKTNKQKQRPFC